MPGAPAEIHQRIDTEVARLSALVTLSRDLHAHPESAMRETHAVRRLTAFLADDFAVTSPYGGRDTSFRADAGSRSPVIAYLEDRELLMSDLGTIPDQTRYW